MDWQSVVAIAVSFCCGTWVVWRFVEPFRSGEDAGCDGCMIRQACQNSGTGEPAGKRLQMETAGKGSSCQAR